MTRGLAVGLILLIAGGEDAAEDGLLTHLYNAGAGGNCERAAALVDEIERTGDARTRLVLGGRLEEGRRCLPADPARAARLYQPAAEQGDPIAMARLGRLYAEGRGVPEDTDQARRWFRGAVLGLVPLAPEERRHAMRLALDGTVPRLLDQQLTWLNLIEASGPASQFDLALRLHAGDGIAKNELAAEQLMGRLAGKGYTPAWYHFGLWRLAKARNHKQRKHAFADIRMAADLGHLPAMLDLARRMLEGRELEQSDYWIYVAFLEARERGADVEDVLTQLEQRLDYHEIRSARGQAEKPNAFPPFTVKE